MNQKEFELIANELKSQHELIHIYANQNAYELACKLWASTLQAQNPKFNKVKFLAGCGITQ